MKDNIASAIGAHRTWVENLRLALERNDVPPALQRAGYDDMCDLGKWLYSLDRAVKVTGAYRRVKDLHYQFHQEAEESVAHALAGDFVGARSISNGEFARTSGALIEALEAWQAEL